MTIRVTQTNGNSTNKIRGSRLSFYDDKNQLVDRFVVPHRNAKWYCRQYPNGKYGRRYSAALGSK